MAQLDLGKLKFTWKGSYTDSTAYEVDDVVFDKGTAWIVTTDVASSNSTDPEANSSFTRMASGINYRGGFSSSNTYYLNDIVSEAGTLWLYINATASNTTPSSSATSHWDEFIAAPGGLITTTAGDLPLRDKSDTLVRLPVGELDSLLTPVKDPLESDIKGFSYVANVAGGSARTAVLTGISNTSTVFGTNTVNAGASSTAKIYFSRDQRRYKITFAADSSGATYSLKDPAHGSYSGAGSGGRLTNAQGVVGNAHVTVSASATTELVIAPNASTPNTIVVRTEANQTDIATITVVDLKKIPQWKPNTKKDRAGSKLTNNSYSKRTTSLQALPSWLEKFGRGGGTVSGAYQCAGYRLGAYIDGEGDIWSWGNKYNDASYNGYDAFGTGFASRGAVYYPIKTKWRLPRFWRRALNGVQSEGKWLYDEHGVDLGYVKGDKPRVVEGNSNSTHGLWLCDNGMVFATGYQGYGVNGSGSTAPTNLCAKSVAFKDKDGNELTGDNRPRIVQLCSTLGSDNFGTQATYGALDENGQIYLWGANNSGQLADDTTTDNDHARMVNPAHFAVSGTNRKILQLYCMGRYAYVCYYAIDEVGDVWAWGNNNSGELGINSTTDAKLPVRLGGVTNNVLNGKVVTHIQCCNGDAGNVGRAWFLTTEGKVYVTGYVEDEGHYSGKYQTNNNDLLMPVELSNASTGYNSVVNSTAQKAVAIWVSGGRYNNIWIQTDGGGTPAQPKIYCYGRVQNGQQGSGVTATAPTASAEGTSFGAELKFRDYGDQVNNTTNNTRPNETIGFQWSTDVQADIGPGKITKIVANNYGSDTNATTLALDEYGQVFVWGYSHDWTLTPYSESDDAKDGAATETYHHAATPCWSLPEPMVDIGFTGHHSGADVGYLLIGKSGTVYAGGNNTWGQAGNNSTSFDGVEPVKISTGGQV